MKGNISDKEITKEISKWIDSFTKEEWREKLVEEKHLFELKKIKTSEWLKEEDIKIFNDFPDIESFASIIEDQRNFTWTSFESEDLLATYSLEDSEILVDSDHLEEAA